MKLNQDSVWTINKNELKILKAAELASKNHKIVPIEMIKKLSKISTNYETLLINLCKSKFLKYETIPYIGYSLTFSGYDCLAINSLRKKGLQIMGEKIGVGKESDIFYGQFKNTPIVLKFHRVGRTSFRTAKNNRDYLVHRKHASWLYFSKLSAEKEYKYMEILSKHNFNIPLPIENNRHVIIMSYLEYHTPLISKKQFDLDIVYNKMMDFIQDLHTLGYVHGDFNEFNVMVDQNNDVKVIDFPQMVPLTDQKASGYLKRDTESVITFFKKKFQYTNEYLPDFIENLPTNVDNTNLVK